MLSFFLHCKINGNQWGRHEILRFHTSVAWTNILVHKILKTTFNYAVVEDFNA